MNEKTVKLGLEKMFGEFRWGEIFPPETLEAKGKKAQLFIDNRIPNILMALRERYAVTNINNWMWGGDLKYRGFRPADCKVGSETSQHRFGRAIDCSFPSMPAKEVREDIVKNQFFWLAKGIRRIEADVTWLHFDLGFTTGPFNTPPQHIVFFEP